MRFVLMFLLFATQMLAAERLLVTPKEKQYDLAPYSTFCMNADKTLRPESFRKTEEPPACYAMDVQLTPQGYTKQTFWVHTRIVYDEINASDLHWVIELDAPLLDYVDLYLFSDRSKQIHYSTGDRRPYAQRALTGPSFFFPITFVPGEKVDLVWRIRSESAIRLPIQLIREDLFAVKERDKMLFLGLFYGVLIVLAVYNLVFMVVFKKIVYLYYVGFILFYGLMQLSFDGLATYYLWPNNMWLANNAVPVFVQLTVICGILFGQFFLNTRQNVPRLHVLLTLVAWGALFPIAMSPFDLYTPMVKITTLFAIVVPILLVITGIAVTLKGERLAYWYLAAWSVFFVGSIVMALYQFGLIPPNWLVIHSQQFGVVLKIFVLSYALGEHMESLLYTDQLTGLQNRRSLEKMIQNAIRYATQNHKIFAVISIDLDDFKTINDSLGHSAGDLLLQEVAVRLKSHLRTQDVVVRLGQDEYLLLIENISVPDAVTMIANELLIVLRRPTTISGQLIHPSASIGIALFPQDGTDTDTLVKNSDNALHKAKEIGKDRFHFFNPSLNKEALEKLELHNDLYEALERGELYLHYQPQIAADTQTIIGAEALIRWYHPERGNIPPDIFIPIAEQSDIILRISHWVIDTVCRQIKAWQNVAGHIPTIAVNITAKDFLDSRFIDKLESTVKAYGLTPDAFDLELTERILVEERLAGTEKVNALRALGFHVSLDDFGTGYSSFSYLKTFSIDTLKIDKSFIDDIETDPGSKAIVKAMISLGHILNIALLAEGVETKSQFNLLKQMGCDSIQGYYFDEPLNARAFSEKYLLPQAKKPGKRQGSE